MYRVYLQEPIHPAAEAYLRAHVQLLTREADLPLADAVLTRNLRIDAAFLEQAKNLKVIAIHGTAWTRRRRRREAWRCFLRPGVMRRRWRN